MKRRFLIRGFPPNKKTTRHCPYCENINITKERGFDRVLLLDRTLSLLNHIYGTDGTRTRDLARDRRAL